MMYLAIICVILFILLFIRVTISITYYRNTQQNKAMLNISLLKNLIKFDIPIDINKEKKKKKDKKFHIKKKKGKNLTKLERYFDKFILSYDILKNTITAVSKYLKKKIICDTLVFKLNFGLGDAAATGIISGLVWGVFYNILALINECVIIKNSDIKIQPDFNKLRLDIEFDCIFTIRIVNIIIVLFITLFNILKGFSYKDLLQIKTNITQKS